MAAVRDSIWQHYSTCMAELDAAHDYIPMHAWLCSGTSQAAAPERTRHSAYWPQDILQKGFKKMELFRGVIRINAGDKSHAYISLPGLSADVFVRVSATCFVMLSQE